MYHILTFSSPLPTDTFDLFGFSLISQKGPFEIQLMVGEYKVLRTIIEYSIPKLVGWSTMFDRNVEQAASRSVGNQQGGYSGGSPHNYQGGGRSY